MSERSPTIRVFLSSTFKEFHAERDLLVRRVFPELRRSLRERGLDLVEVDLRWGITDEQSQSGDTIPICLAEIDRCTYFVGFLGDIYSPYLPPLDPSLLEIHPWLGEFPGASVTEMEMLYAALLPEAPRRNASLFFLRESNGVAASGARLTQLKRRVRDSGLPVVDDCADPQTLAARLHQDLAALIERDYPVSAAADPAARLDALHDAFARERARHFAGRTSDLAQLDDWLANAEAPPLLVTGAAGAGKSALLGHWTPGKAGTVAVLTHFVGGDPESDTPLGILRRLTYALRRRGAGVADPPVDPALATQALAACLAAAGDDARRCNRPWLIVLDGLDKLRLGRDLLWLPRALPAGVRLLASSVGDSERFTREQIDDFLGLTRTELAALGEHDDGIFSSLRSDDPATDAWRRRDWRVLVLEELDESARSGLVSEAVSRFRKTLSPSHAGRILAHLLAGNPLFLRTVLDELRVSATYHDFDARLDYYLAAPSLIDLFDRVLHRLEGDCTRDVVANVCVLLWASRAGLEEPELISLSGATPLQWSAFAVQTQGLIDAAARVAFASPVMREAARRRYLTSAGIERGVRRTLAARFAAGGPTVRGAEEVPWQLRHAESWPDLERLLLDMDWLPALLDRGDEELLEHWLPLQQRGRDPAALLTAAWRTRFAGQPTPERVALGKRLARFLRFAGAQGQAGYDFHAMLADEARQALGPRHPDTLRIERTLSEVLLAQGRVRDAERLIHGVYTEHQRLLAPGSPELAETMSVCAGVMEAQYNYGAAEAMLAPAYEALRRHHGVAAPATSAAAALLARCAAVRGDPETAARLRFDTFEACRALYGPYHPETLSASDQAFEARLDDGELVGAMFECRAVLEARERLLGLDHPLTLASAVTLALALDRLAGSSARELMSYALQRMEHVLGDDHPATLDVLSMLADRLVRYGAYEQGAQLHRRIYEARQRTQGREHPMTLMALEQLAYAHYCLGRFAEARELQGELCDRLAHLLGADAGWTNRAAAFLADIDRARLNPEILDAYLQRPLAFGPAVGIAFDIDGLGGGEYGRASYRVVFDAVDPSLLRDTRWRDGDTNATLAGRERTCLISIESAHAEAIPAIRAALERSQHPGLLPGSRRFVETSVLQREPLVISMRIGPRGVPDWANGGGFPLDAWHAAREARGAVRRR